MKIFNPSPASPGVTPSLSGPPTGPRRSPSPLSRNISGGSGSGSGASEASSRQRSGKYLSTSRSSSPTPTAAGLGGKSYCHGENNNPFRSCNKYSDSGHLAHRSSAKASSHSRATTPTSPMFVKLFSAKHSAYSSRESICQVRSRLIVTLDIMLFRV